MNIPLDKKSFPKYHTLIRHASWTEGSWAVVLGVGITYGEGVNYAAPAGISKVTFTDLAKEWEMSSDGGLTWRPACQ